MPHRLIKQKRIAQLINGEPGENQYRPTTRELLTKYATPKHKIASQPNPTPNVHQPHTATSQRHPNESNSTEDHRHHQIHEDKPDHSMRVIITYELIVVAHI